MMNESMYVKRQDWNETSMNPVLIFHPINWRKSVVQADLLVRYANNPKWIQCGMPWRSALLITLGWGHDQHHLGVLHYINVCPY